MSTKLALILTGVWTFVVIAAGVAAVWFVVGKVPPHQQEVRGEKLGIGLGGVAGIGYGAIWLPWAFARGRERRRERG